MHADVGEGDKPPFVCDAVLVKSHNLLASQISAPDANMNLFLHNTLTGQEFLFSVPSLN
jgi:hypothetical protein